MPSSGMACLIRATRRGGAIGSAQSSVPRVMCSAICRDMYAKYLHAASANELLRTSVLKFERQRSCINDSVTSASAQLASQETTIDIKHQSSHVS